MKHGSLFSGIGGFDLASEWMGWENVFHCEIAEFPRKILHYYWPNSISYENIKETDFTIHRARINILTGGFPCQPFSMAGKRKGTEDERHLWPEMLRAIREIQPRWIVGENVFGLVNWDAGLVFEQVQSDLEAEGYEVQAFILPAAGVGSCPHRRDRVWFVAYSNRNGYIKSFRGGDGEKEKISREHGQENSTTGEFVRTNKWNVADTECERLEGYDRQWEGCTKYRTDEGLFIGTETKFNASDTEISRSSRQCKCKQRKIQFNGQNCGNIPTKWENFPTQSPICGRNDGISTELDGITFSKWRNESIKGYGNAIVPQVVLQIFKAIQEYESQR